MGESILALGNEAEARRVWREALRLATVIHATPVALEALARFASLQAKQGDLEQALEMLLMVLNHPVSFHETRDCIARLRTELEAQLTSQQVKAALARAQAKTFEVVVDELLAQD
jgi:hypothetical protein